MRPILIALALVCLSATASYAQCPSGVCPTSRPILNAGPLAATALRGTTVIRSRVNYGDGMIGVGSTARRERRRGFFFRRR